MILLVALGLLTGAGCYLYKWKVKELRQRKISNQLQEALGQMAHALRIGVGMQQAFEYIARESAAPLCDEWKRLLQRVSLGVSWTEAMADLPARVLVPEMQWFVTALEITRRTGGPLADVMDGLAEALNERHALRDKVETLTAQGKASGAILAALPFVILAALRCLVPELVRPLFVTPVGQSLLVGVMVSVLIGGWIIWKLVHVAEG